jgi:hypothetical protein
LIAVMVYSFARVGAALAMKLEDYFTEGKGWPSFPESSRPSPGAPSPGHFAGEIPRVVDVVAGLTRSRRFGS